jgi:hypothetical protein
MFYLLSPRAADCWNSLQDEIQGEDDYCILEELARLGLIDYEGEGYHHSTLQSNDVEKQPALEAVAIIGSCTGQPQSVCGTIQYYDSKGRLQTCSWKGNKCG